MDQRLLQILSAKPELVSEFPEWMLPQDSIERLRSIEHTAILEIAGRDSFAAALKAPDDIEVKAYLPTIAYTGTQFGEWRIPLEKIDLLRDRLRPRRIDVFDAVLMGAPRFWRLLCGRFAVRQSRELGFHSPCLGCHLYFHAVRIPLAKMVNCRTVISGERQSHHGKIKINQLPQALDAYVAFMQEFDIDLALPLRHTISNQEIETIVGEGWHEGSDQVECVLSKNYLDTEGNPMVDEEAIRRYFEDYALSAARETVSEMLRAPSGEIVDSSQ